MRVGDFITLSEFLLGIPLLPPLPPITRGRPARSQRS